MLNHYKSMPKQSFILKKLEEIEKEFDDSAWKKTEYTDPKSSTAVFPPSAFYWYWTPQDAKKFLFKVLTQSLHEFAEEIRLEKKKIDKKFSIDERRFPHGYNTAKADLDKKISELLK